MSRSEPQSWQAGLAAVDITPEEPIWQAGWGGRTTPSQGVTTRIFAKAIALKYGNDEVAVLLSSDLMAYSAEFVDLMVRSVKDRYGIDRSRFVLCATHNHSAPVTTNVLPLYYEHSAQQADVIQRYSDGLHEKFMSAVDQAMANLAPSTLSFGSNFAGFATNRRRARPGGLGLPQVVDHDVPVLIVRDASHEVRGIVFGYACHTTTIEDRHIHGDYAGIAQKELQERYPKAVAMFIAGCGGDQGPNPRFQPGMMEMYGRILATAVHDQIRHHNCWPNEPVEGPLNTAVEVASLKLDTAPTRAELEAMLPGRTGTQLREVQYQLSRLDAGKPLASEVPYPLQLWRFGSGHTLVIMSSEVVVDYSTLFKQKFGPGKTWVMAYANEHIAYIPSRRIREEGGYEGLTGMMECGFPAPFTHDVERNITGVVERLHEKAGQATPR